MQHVICSIPAASGRSDIVRLACSSNVHQYYSQGWKSRLRWSLRNSYTPGQLKRNQTFCYIFLWFVFWLWSHVRLRFHLDLSVITVSKTRQDWFNWTRSSWTIYASQVASYPSALMIRTFCLLTMCLHLGHANWRNDEYRRGNVKTDMFTCIMTSKDIDWHLPLDRKLFLIASIAESMPASLINVHPESCSS